MEWVSEKMKNQKKSGQEITKSIGTAGFFDSTINRSFKVEIWHINIDATGIKRYEVKFQDRDTSSIWLKESKLRNVSITSQRKRKTNATRPTQPLQTIAPLRNPIGTVELSHSTFRRWVKAQIWGKKDDELGKEGSLLRGLGEIDLSGSKIASFATSPTFSSKGKPSWSFPRLPAQNLQKNARVPSSLLGG